MNWERKKLDIKRHVFILLFSKENPTHFLASLRKHILFLGENNFLKRGKDFSRKEVFATNANFLILISLKPDGVNLI